LEFGSFWTGLGPLAQSRSGNAASKIRDGTVLLHLQHNWWKNSMAAILAFLIVNAKLQEFEFFETSFGSLRKCCLARF